MNIAQSPRDEGAYEWYAAKQEQRDMDEFDQFMRDLKSLTEDQLRQIRKRIQLGECYQHVVRT